MKLLFLYASTNGHTRTISQHLATYISAQQPTWQITQQPIETAHTITPSEFDGIILGASIRYGKHHRAVSAFIHQHQHTLTQRLFAFYSVNLTARKPEKNTPQTNPYVQKFYQALPIKPTLDAVFAGRLAYPEYAWYNKLMICLIMKLTHGPTNLSTIKVFTDWQAVEHFAQRLIAHLGQR